MIAALKDKKIGVICGGMSRERPVSLVSGERVYRALIKLGYQAVKVDPLLENVLTSGIDVAFVALHGEFGEDGAIQGLLELNKIPYTGSGVSASAIGIHKIHTKQLLQKAGLPTAPYQMLVNDIEVPELPFEYPVVVKPVAEGSSFGVAICDSAQELQRYVKSNQQLFNYLFVEKYIDGQEVTVGILQENQNHVFALPVLELRAKKRFYDYEAKYTKGMTAFILPANLSKAVTEQCQQIALDMFHLLGCKGMARVDMMVSPSSGPCILEINTIPGLTELSDLPAQADAAGISYEKLIELILNSALY